MALLGLQRPCASSAVPTPRSGGAPYTGGTFETSGHNDALARPLQSPDLVFDFVGSDDVGGEQVVRSLSRECQTTVG
jgi:hypothetical protein